MSTLAPEWTALDETMSPRTPFTGPLWNDVWWHTLRANRPLGRDELFLHVVRDDTDALVAVAPMVLTRRPALGPAAVRAVRFFGADPNITEMRGVVCRLDDQARVVRALADHLLETESVWDWVEWAGIRRGSDAEAVLEREYGALWDTEILDYYVKLGGTWEEFKSALPRNVKESIRRCYNRLKRDGYRFTFRVVDSLDGGTALNRFFDLHAARAKMPTSVQHCDAFEEPRSRSFMIEYARRAAEAGALRLFELEISGEVVAARLGFVLGEELYLYHSGYAPEWGRYSVMTTVLAESIRWAIDRGLKIVNLSSGRDVSKTRWRPSEVVLRRGVCLSPRPRSRLAFEAYRALLRGHRRGVELRRLIRGSAAGP